MRLVDFAAYSAAESAYPATPFARIESGMHIALVNRIDVDAAERLLVSGSHDKTVRVWDLATGELLQTLRVPIDEGDVGKIYAVALSPDGSTVPRADLWCIATRKTLFTCSTAKAEHCAGVSAVSTRFLN